MRKSNLPGLEISRLGGDVAVDFLNTVAWRLDPQKRRETLDDYPHVLAWMTGCDVIAESEAVALLARAAQDPAQAGDERARVLALRDDVYAALTDDGSPALLADEIQQAQGASTLARAGDGTWRWSTGAVDLATPRHRIALELMRLLTSAEVARLHRCEDRACGWVFLDTSRQGNRRWCSSADCGNRNRARIHYARTRGRA